MSYASLCPYVVSCERNVRTMLLAHMLAAGGVSCGGQSGPKKDLANTRRSQYKNRGGVTAVDNPLNHEYMEPT